MGGIILDVVNPTNSPVQIQIRLGEELSAPYLWNNYKFN